MPEMRLISRSVLVEYQTRLFLIGPKKCRSDVHVMSLVSQCVSLLLGEKTMIKQKFRNELFVLYL